MKKELTIDDFKSMLEHALKNISERVDEFSSLDAVIGDGDHGQAIYTAILTAVNTARQGVEFKSMRLKFVECLPELWLTCRNRHKPSQGIKP